MAEPKKILKNCKFMVEKKMKFREFLLATGTKFLLGKDKEQNEALVKSFIGKNNFILHTASPGSPFCVIEKMIFKGDVHAAAVVCARYSQDWRDNKKDIIVNVFTGKDVYKSKIMPIGTFGVKKQKKIIVKKKEILEFEKSK